MEKVIIWKRMAEAYCNSKLPVYIRDVADNFYFGYLEYQPGDDKVTIKCFAPKQRKGLTIELVFDEIIVFKKHEVRNAS